MLSFLYSLSLKLLAMLPFLYNISLKLLYPTSLCLIFLFASAILRSRGRKSHPPSSVIRHPFSDFAARLFFWLAVAVLLVCGNGWVVGTLTRHLERQYPPLSSVSGSSTTESPVVSLSRGLVVPPPVVSGPFSADAILVLGGGTVSQIPPRQMVEVSEAGDRVLYAARLYREGRAPIVVCTSGIATGGIAPRPPAEDMAELLESIGVPKSAILKETKSGNTHEHAQCMGTVLQDHQFKRVLLVTSAMHMPRSMGVFKRSCPYAEFIPAPTDFRVTDRLPAPWYRQLVALVPTPSTLLQFSEVMHEYLGIFYYRLRGWL